MTRDELKAEIIRSMYNKSLVGVVSAPNAVTLSDLADCALTAIESVIPVGRILSGEVDVIPSRERVWPK